MIFQPGFFGRLFSASGKWVATIDGDHLVIRNSGTDTRLVLNNIHHIEIGSGLIWPELQINVESTPIRLGGLVKQHADRFRHVLKKSIACSLFRAIKPASSSIPALMEQLESFYRLPGYLANRDVTLWQNGLMPTKQGFVSFWTPCAIHYLTHRWSLRI